MDFELSADQKMLADTLASFVKKESPVARMRKLRDDALGFDRATWKKMGELGWLAIPFSEAAGGLGGSFVDAALVLEHFGATLVPEPYVSSVVLAGYLLAEAGTDAQREAWLHPMIAGDSTLAVAYAERASRYDVQRVATTAKKTSSGWELTGEKIFVLDGHAAAAFVVSARTRDAEGDADGVSLFVVDAKTDGVKVQPITTMDGRRAAMLRFAGAKLGADALLGEEAGATPLLERMIDRGAAAACAEGVGIVRRCLEMTVEYLNTRKQFGVKIGTFQVLQHRAVDMFIEVETARSMAILASIRVGDDDEVRRKAAVSTAKAQLAQSGRLVTAQAIQLHGGIGVTEEHDIGLYFKRFHVLAALFGDEEHHVQRFASLPGFDQGVRDC